ncbi:hypothetical protein D3C85_1505610 [compost metagenome]
MQHFDQAVFQLEALVQQATQLAQLFGKAFGVLAFTLGAMVIEGQCDLSTVVDPWVDLFGQLQRLLVAEGLGLTDQLLADFEMPRRNVVDKERAKLPVRVLVGEGRLGIAQRAESLHQFLALLQPAVDQFVNPTPAFLSVLTTIEHGDLFPSG